MNLRKDGVHMVVQSILLGLFRIHRLTHTGQHVTLVSVIVPILSTVPHADVHCEGHTPGE